MRLLWTLPAFCMCVALVPPPSNAQLYYGVPSFAIGANSTLVLTNADTNIWYLTAIEGTWSNAIACGHFSLKHQRGMITNAPFAFEFCDATNFVWYPEGNLRIGRADLLHMRNATTNTMFLILSQER